MPTILITGTTSGIGEAAVHAFRGAGWKVLATYRPERGDPWASTDGVEGLPLELRSEASIAALVERVSDLDVLYCNAGIVLAGPVETCTDEQVRELYQTNVFGHLALVRGLLPALRRSALREDGRAGILWTCSITSEVTMPFMTHYSATKGAIRAYAEGLNLELEAQGLWSKALFPAMVATPIYEKFRFAPIFPAPYHEAWSHLANQVDGMRGSPPEDVAKVALEAVTDDEPDRVRYYPTADAKAVPAARRTLGQGAFWKLYRESVLRTPGKLVELALKAIAPSDQIPIRMTLAPQAVVDGIEPDDPAHPSQDTKHEAAE